MKVKELRKKYKDYTIELYGKPLDREMIPYSYLPICNLENYNVIEIKVINKKHKEISFNLKTKSQKTKELKGFVQAYIKGDEING